MGAELQAIHNDRSMRMAKPARRTAPRVATLQLVAVSLVATLVAAIAFIHYSNDFASRWRQLHHDRNTHYLQAIRFALELRSLDLAGFAGELLSARTWPPLHNLSSGLVMSVFGVGPKTAVVPDVLAFAGLAVFAFLIARRLAPAAPNVAGWTAVCFVLASPAHRVYATDVMLESLGACLTLASVYYWICARDSRLQPSSQSTAWTRCSASLTLLFLTKYNYWLLVLLSICGGEVLADPIGWFRQMRAGIAKIPWRSTLCYLLRQPLTIPVVAAIAATIYCLPRGGETIRLLGRKIVIEDKCYNLLTLDLLLMVGWLFPWWLRDGRVWVRNSSTFVRSIFRWHAVPVVIWLALPKRFGYFIWYLSPNNGPVEADRPMDFLVPQWQWWTTQYHVGVWSFWIAAALTTAGSLAFAVSAIARFRWPSPGRIGSGSPDSTSGVEILYVLLALSAFLTIRHPQHYDRYSHTWIPSLWILAGIGIGELSRLFSTKLGVGVNKLMFACVVGIWTLHLPEMLNPGHSIDEGHRHLSSARVIANGYLNQLDDKERVTFLGTQPFGAFLQWSFLERFGDLRRCDAFVKRFGRDSTTNEKLLADWLQSAKTPKIVVVDVPPDSQFYYPGFDHYRQYVDFMSRQSTYVADATVAIPGAGCIVTVWRRIEPMAAKRGASQLR